MAKVEEKLCWQTSGSNARASTPATKTTWTALVINKLIITLCGLVTKIDLPLDPIQL